jgi:uncharacterized circularly permuted ATP-grasp superfamily protein/uncharacterized alpha-E superfamily protein
MAKKSKTIKSQDERVADVINGYARMEGVADELLNHDGTIRPVWQEFINFFSSLSDATIQKRFARGDQYLRDAGVFYRRYDQGDANERDWPFSHIPIILDEGEWDHIAQGLIQRADLLEYVMADLYGAQDLVTQGHLPAELIAATPEWLRPMVGATPKSGSFLHLLAFEIGRGPDGTWWVLGDRTQAPSGAGFALENRVATNHVFADHYAKMQIHRLAGFFKRFRSSLMDMAAPDDCGVGILTPGRLNDAYYEHAYIARYLGFMLLEGEDLIVHQGKTMVRTVDGLRPISVLWRRLDSSFADPLEFNEASILGTPGMANAVRNGALNMVNALGSGVLENRFMLAFLPRICEAIRGEKLLIPNIASWWCGQEKERDQVLGNTENLMFGPAHSTFLPFEQNEMFSLMGNGEHVALRDQVLNNGQDYVAQEAIKLSTTPVYIDGKLRPRPMTIRVFLARTENGWDVMPGGYARIGQEKGETVLALQGGGQVADVWIKSQGEIERESITDTQGKTFVRQVQDVLPSRAADNLFWLGRYIERSEMMMRMARGYHIRLGENEGQPTPLLQFMSHHFAKFEVEEGAPLAKTINATLFSAMGSAGHVRDRFSNDGWAALKDLSRTAQIVANDVPDGDEAANAYHIMLRKISGFAGLVHESMYHYTGWRFLKIGRALERASITASLLDYFTKTGVPDGALELPVEICDSTMTHRRRYLVTTNSDTVVDLLALDGMNPRSILYQINDFKEHLSFLPGQSDQVYLSDLAKTALKIHTDLSVSHPDDLEKGYFKDLEEDIYTLCNMLNEAYLS